MTKSVTRGVCRGLADLDYCVLTEFSLKNGRRADVIGLGKAGDVVIVEVKVTIADFLGDRKWPDYGDFCDRLSFAVPPDFPQELLPAECGLMVADAYSAEVIRQAPERPMHASRRKALILRFARNAARRWHGLSDPGPSLAGGPGLIVSAGGLR
ncbi:MAG: MmcB family DNA repair protein [Alphaproteobacteria bacterium]